MQYRLGFSKFTESPVFVPELFVLVCKRLDHDFFNMLTLMLAEADGSKPKKERTDEEENYHGGTMKIDATCCDAEVRYPTDCNLLEDGSNLIDRLLNKFCTRYKITKPRTHRVESRQAFIQLTKKKRKGKKLVDKTKLVQIRCLQADFQTFFEFLGRHASDLLACFSRRDCKWLMAAIKMYEQQKMMFEQNVCSCADRIISIYQTNDIRAKLDNTADTWIGACFFAKNAMKFLKGLLCLIFAELALGTLKKRIISIAGNLMRVSNSPQGLLVIIN